ncbi:Two component regulator propeller [Mucilaginibacter pineti]|uniref:Two component regulator propeller n=1 Tax=Mucilaginibacter pineti TaxID=1391627 RepID=A0A1G6XWY1_9SPHI|nr:sensor histidine kinase [Mucilaginibacter pineti]SDD81905.1 Two component regulator propeller [Mucilaginibacter pineti]
MTKTFLFRVVALVCVVYLGFIGARPAYAQKYTFAHYDIEDGLIQSQVNRFSMDADHRLWMGTFGGACRFDGKEFIGYSRQNGLPNNFVGAVLNDREGRNWFGTLGGLAMLQNGKITLYNPDITLKRNVVTNIVQDAAGTVWVVIGETLFKINGQKLQHVVIADNAIVTNLTLNSAGRVYAAVFKQGIYCFNGRSWNVCIRLSGNYQELPIRRMMFDRVDKQKLYLLTWFGMFTVKGDVVTSLPEEQAALIKGQLLSFAQDADNNLWIGTDNGAYCICSDGVTHYSSQNGLTDNSIADIYLDADNNLWLGSLGNGVFRFEGNKFLTFDGSQGLHDAKIVMGITLDWNNDVLLGAEGGGLIRYDGKKLFDVKTPVSPKYFKGIQCLYTDKNKTVWIGTALTGLWQYNSNGFKQIKGSPFISFNGITSDSKGTLWMASSQGCFYYENGLLKQLEGVPTFTTSIVITGHDSLFVGTQNGIVLVVNKKVMNTYNQKFLKNTTILCMINYKGMMLVGTDDRGLFSWDLNTGALKNYTINDGLKSNSIYSLVADDREKLWIGTGRGVNRMSYKTSGKKFEIIDNIGTKEQVMESNQNAIVYKDHKVWVGTTKAVMVYNTKVRMQPSPPPHIIIETVKLMPQINNNADTNITYLNNGVQLNHTQNHLSISFLGVYLKNPDGVSYRYKLVGLDSTFCAPVKNNVVDYPSLPPGKYTFQVKAISPDGKVSVNTASFGFCISSPFYKTFIFQASVILFFMLIGFGVQRFLHALKIQRQNAIEVMKQDEKIKIRQQTAEDFHDDLGNKLTRISILSEILNAKIDKDKADQRGLVEQIKQNAAALYNGTKDILWALDPKSDNLYETLVHIKEIGIELFQDMPVNFKFEGIDQNLRQIKLPMEYSRNITMIFKELLNNSLKHAEAAEVIIQLVYTDKNEISLYFTDNGKGFDEQKHGRGHGINNIKARAKRINAGLVIFSEEGKGTNVELKFKKNGLV